ncbi:AGAP000013-PA-like protein [Anopheles sinensis]|uniref:AGAP000013-PA-like protein n=1 Tax=Anopheles sinensis TaxID=74873 RepID=A0A084VIV5_ANOSI|nr:AGAP000013-PA-like protein [Anopheles sinensis]
MSVGKLDRLLWFVCLLSALALSRVAPSAVHPVSRRERSPDVLDTYSDRNDNEESGHQPAGQEGADVEKTDERLQTANGTIPIVGAAREPTNGGRKTDQHNHLQKHSHHHRVAESKDEEGGPAPVASGSINHGRGVMNGGRGNGNGSSGNEYGTHFHSRTAKGKGPIVQGGQGDGEGPHQPDEQWYSIRRLLIDWSWPECLGFEAKEHLYYQIGHALFLVAFLAPNIPCGFLVLRCAAIAGCILMLLWGWFVNCSLDAVVWFGGFLVVNTIYAVILLCKLRPVKFDREIESVYVALFKPLRVSRHQFKKVLNCMKIVRSLKFQEIYVQEKITKVDSLSLVLSGKLVISQNHKAHHIVFPHQFLDSPEWFGVSTDDYFQVSIMAMEDSRVLIWHRDKLKLSMISEPFLETVFDHILGRDVVKKLMQVTQVGEIMAQGNGCVPSSFDDAEDKPMLAKGKGTDNGGHGLTALINRQLQDSSIPLLPFRSDVAKVIRGVRPIYPVRSGTRPSEASSEEDVEKGCDVTSNTIPNVSARPITRRTERPPERGILGPKSANIMNPTFMPIGTVHSPDVAKLARPSAAEPTSASSEEDVEKGCDVTNNTIPNVSARPITRRTERPPERGISGPKSAKYHRTPPSYQSGPYILPMLPTLLDRRTPNHLMQVLRKKMKRLAILLTILFRGFRSMFPLGRLHVDRIDHSSPVIVRLSQQMLPNVLRRVVECQKL